MGIPLTWKDSMKLFPVSLEDLCVTFKQEGKLQSYDKMFNNVEFLNDPAKVDLFIKDGLQDSIALAKALKVA